MSAPLAVEMAGVRVLVLAEDGPSVASERDARDLVAAAIEHDARWLAIPVARCGDGFFELRTRVLGEVVQKLVNYGLCVAFVGDLSQRAAESAPLRDFVRETSRGRQVWFVASTGELAERLAALGSTRP